MTRRTNPTGRTTPIKVNLLPLRWGAATAAAGFIPILVGLLTASPPPRLAAWILGICGGVAAGIVGIAQSATGQRERRVQKEISQQLKNQVRDIEQRKKEIELERDRLQLARTQSNQALGQAGALMLQIWLQRSQDTLDRLLQFLMKSLHSALSARGPVTVSFLQYHGGGRMGLPDPLLDNGSQVIYTIRDYFGDDNLNAKWQITRSSEEEVVAKRVYDEEQPWKKGVVVPDTSSPGWSEHAVLQMPTLKGRIKSYCRAPLKLAGQPLGFLCVDAAEPNGVTRDDYNEMIEPFGLTIATGFAVYYMTTSNAHESGQGVPDD